MVDRGRGRIQGQDAKHRVREQFGASGDAYVVSSTHREGADLTRLLEVAELHPDDTVLDIATGGGHTALAVAPFVKTVIVVDLTPEMLMHARRFLHQHAARPRGFVAADAESLPFPAARFHAVTCRIAPHHFPHVTGFVNEVSRVLALDGLFMLIDSVAPEDATLDAFINTLELRRDPSHIRSHSASEWRQYLTQAGLLIEHEEIIQKRHDFNLWTARSRMAEFDRESLEEFALSAGTQIANYFDFDIQGGRLVSFRDEKILLKARKSTRSASPAETQLRAGYAP